MTWNPIDWTAGPFLSLYGTLAVVLLLGCFLLRSRIGPAAHATRQLSMFELAYLAGGARRLGDSVLLSLTSGFGATIDSSGSKITVTSQKPLASQMNRPPLLPVRPGMTRAEFQTAVEPLVARVKIRLQELGYCPSDDQMIAFYITVLPFVGLLLAFGVMKAVVGAERHHPIGFLIMMLITTAFAGIALAKRPTRTRAGNDVLGAYKATHARAARAPLDKELLLAVALSGAVVLSDTAYAPIYAASKTMSSSGSDGGSGCGGGGGGCGGCSG